MVMSQSYTNKQKNIVCVRIKTHQRPHENNNKIFFFPNADSHRHTKYTEWCSIDERCDTHTYSKMVVNTTTTRKNKK